jgi:hypothetical protein
MFFDLVKFNWARDISDLHLGTNLKNMEKMSAQFGYKLDGKTKVAIIRNLKAQHPPIDVNAIACILAAHFVSSWVQDSEETIGNLRVKITDYAVTMTIPWKYINYCYMLLDRECELQDILDGTI